jgi:hypothetical protein
MPPAAHRPGQGAVHPDGLAALDQEAPDQIRGGQVVVAGDGDQGALEPPGHVLHEAGLAAAGGALEQHREAVAVGRLEDGDLVAHRLVVGLVDDEIFLGLQDPERVLHR